MCFGSLCPWTNVPLCHNSTSVLIRCNILYLGMKGFEDSFVLWFWNGCYNNVLIMVSFSTSICFDICVLRICEP
jgi:hypothetical protein